MTAGNERRLERHSGVAQNIIINPARRLYLLCLTYCITKLMPLTSNMPFCVLIDLITLPVPCSYFSKNRRIFNLSKRSIDRLPSLLHQMTRQHSRADAEQSRYPWDSLDFTDRLAVQQFTPSTSTRAQESHASTERSSTPPSTQHQVLTRSSRWG